jgi:hypothetical protein
MDDGLGGERGLSRRAGNPSADPGAKTEPGAAQRRSNSRFRDWHEGAKSDHTDKRSPADLPTHEIPFYAGSLHSVILYICSLDLSIFHN